MTEKGRHRYLLNNAEKIFDRILDILAFMAILMLIFMMLVVCYDVVMRYIFHNPPGWVVEICEYLLLYVTFFSHFNHPPLFSSPDLGIFS